MSSEESETEMVGSGDSSAEEMVGRKAQEALEQSATQAMEEGGVSDNSTETMAVIGEEEREKVMKLYGASMPEVLGKMGIERMVKERAKTIEKRRKVELIKEGIREMFSTSGSMRDGGSLRCTWKMSLTQNGRWAWTRLGCGS